MMSLNQTNVSDSASKNSMSPVTSLVTPADPVATNTAQQVTQWVDDTALQSASLPAPIVPNRDILSSAAESRSHNILDILERPVQVAQVEWQSTTPFDTPINLTDTSPDLQFPQALINSAPNLANKINHFTFLRAHIVVRFVVNANTFQAGRLVALFAPYSQFSDIGSRTSVNNYMSARTVFPRVVLDAGSGNSGELIIPYVSYFTHYNLALGLGDLGTVNLVVLNPLSTGSATVSIFAHFTNISLDLPTAVPNELGTFSSLFSAIAGHTVRNKNCNAKCLKNKVMKSLLPRAQVGEAVEKASHGVLSSTFASVAGISSAAATLPVIGKYLTPISWMASAAAQVAAYFGLSKSNNLIPTNKFINIPAFGFTNLDGIDNSAVLGSSIENEIGSRHDVFGSGLDEMDVAFVAQHECYLTGFEWANSDVPGTDLLAFQVGPGATESAIVGPTNLFNSTALSYIGTMFRFWRGSLRYKIQLTKTAYHSGRIRISFVPGGSLPVSPNYDYNQGYSEIVDLRTSDEIIFTVPFASNTIWKPFEMVPIEFPGAPATCTGVIVIEVLNQLRNPASVSSTIQGNVWVSGGEDIQFSVPDFLKYMPCIDDAESLSSSLDRSDVRLQDAPCFDDNIFSYFQDFPRAQVLGQFQDTGFNVAMKEHNDMFSSPQMSAVDASATCIGEHVQSLRALTRRFGPIGNYSIPANAASALRVSSNYFGTLAKTSVPTTSIAICPVDYISWLYRFYRGGMRFKFMAEGSVVSGNMVAFSDPGLAILPSSPMTIPTAASRWSVLLNAGGVFTHYINLIYNRIMEISLPYYSTTHISLLRDIDATITEADDRASHAFLVSEGEVEVQAFKAAGDDFSFGWLVGPPKVIPRPPGGIVYTITFGEDVETATCADNVVTLTPVTISPAITINTTLTFLYSNTPSVPIFTTSTPGTPDQVPTLECNVVSDNDNVVSFTIPHGCTLYDAPTTLAYYKGAGPIIVIA